MDLPTENVWLYPRPPRLEAVELELRVLWEGEEIARTRRGHRVLETSHPPVYYFPPEDVAEGILQPASGRSLCEWKGFATYYDLRLGERTLRKMAWGYDDPPETFAAIAGHVAFYAGVLDGFVGEEQVTPQPGGFYGGWVTSNVVGPFKGLPGTEGW